MLFYLCRLDEISQRGYGSCELIQHHATYSVSIINGITLFQILVVQFLQLSLELSVIAGNS